jgi:poly-gamma-glutamate synthesis protein (capsule biosynthesis protein)
MKSIMLFFGLIGFFLFASVPSLASSEPIRIFLSGDVMTGRGIDQVLPYPSNPIIYEPYMKKSTAYVDLAVKANGAIQRPVNYSYIWGDAIKEMAFMAPDIRIINLETSITKSNDYWKGKGIHYRMHPENIPIITVAQIDFCSLANNHILDWGYTGLSETLQTLKNARLKSGGAGHTFQEAEKPAVLDVPGKGRVIIFSYGSGTSGIPQSWAATEARPGVNLLRDLSAKTVKSIKDHVSRIEQKGDIIIVSIHWGSNWGYYITPDQREFAHKLIDEAGIDIIHGHSSHHVKGIEVYNGRLIIYGSGDLLNDYEGISGQEEFRPDLSLMYFVSMDPSSGKLIRLQMTPTQMKRFSIHKAAKADALWLRNTLNREGKQLKTRVEIDRDNRLTLEWK